MKKKLISFLVSPEVTHVNYLEDLSTSSMFANKVHIHMYTHGRGWWEWDLTIHIYLESAVFHLSTYSVYLIITKLIKGSSEGFNSKTSSVLHMFTYFQPVIHIFVIPLCKVFTLAFAFTRKQKSGMGRSIRSCDRKEIHNGSFICPIWKEPTKMFKSVLWKFFT